MTFRTAVAKPEGWKLKLLHVHIVIRAKSIILRETTKPLVYITSKRIVESDRQEVN